MTAALAPAFTPACMEPDELASWQEMNDRVLRQGRGVIPCMDCLAGFAAEMSAVGRCNGTPHGVEEDTEMDHPPAATA